MKNIISISILFIIISLFLMCTDDKKAINKERIENHISVNIDSTTILKSESFVPLHEVSDSKDSTIIEKLDVIFRNKKYNYTPLTLVHHNLQNAKFQTKDWVKIQNVYEKWRQNQVAIGNYVSNCGNSAEEFVNIPYNSRYALPKFPKTINVEILDTLMVDVNYDEKTDIILRIRPIDCLEGNGSAAHPTINLLIVSKSDEYEVIENSILYRIEQVLQRLRTDITRCEYQWIEFDKAISNEGIITLSGSSFIYLEHDASCCYSIVCNFTCYTDSIGKGYINIDVKYNNWLDDSKKSYKLCIKL